ncbi:synaptogenesis protein syg-2-like, partial [Limulus polyphemus]|uniref:Synaptogenesis protein syg-2-like n=1 Tax=Limulus polyphemus TaxID=6850 RepID=A0ABM1C1X0_LIMPO
FNIHMRYFITVAPAEVVVSGPKEAKPGETVTITCATSRSNPAADINWLVDGQHVEGANTITADPEGGWISNSNITVIIQSQERLSKIFQCFAANKDLGETIVESYVLSILYPPEPPNILGYSEEKPIRAGEMQRITCVSNGGNPLPALKWFRGDEEVNSVTTTNGNVVNSEVSIVIRESDNGVQYRCEASNSASVKPLISKMNLNVHFPPSRVTIKLKPEKLRAGGKVSLVCESASSNPVSVITWWHDGFLLQGTPGSVLNATHGGKSSRNILQLNVTSDDNGSKYTCQAMNEAMEISVHYTVTLNISHKPEFYKSPMEIYDIVEGKSTFINLTARGNPNIITYRWAKVGNPVINIQEDRKLNYFKNVGVSSNGPILKVTNAVRTDGGKYKCEATNEEGASEIIIVLNVQYPSFITKLSEITLVDRGASVDIECVVDANPVTDNIISWRRNHYEMNRTKQSFEDGRSLLTIYDVSWEDSGVFECIADNGIGEKNLKKAYLVVKHKPIIDQSPPLLKAASEKDEIAKITCRAKGAPNITFTWSREGATVSDNVRPDKYYTETSVLDLTTWESVLYVKRVKNHDYGEYECVAKNELGFDNTKIILESKRGVPDNETERVTREVMSEKIEIPRIIITCVSVVGTFLLVINIVLVICFVRRRRKKGLEE